MEGGGTKIRLKINTSTFGHSQKLSGEDKYSNVADLSEAEVSLLKGYQHTSRFKENIRRTYQSFKDNSNKKKPRLFNATSPTAQTREQNYEPRKLFVKNFHSKEALERLFAMYGVDNISVIETQKNFPIAFITLKNDIDVVQAIHNLHNTTEGATSGHALVVERARLKPLHGHSHLFH